MALGDVAEFGVEAVEVELEGSVLDVEVGVEFGMGSVVEFGVEAKFGFAGGVVVPLIVVGDEGGVLCPDDVAEVVAEVVVACPSYRDLEVFVVVVLGREGEAVEMVVEPFLSDKVGGKDGVGADDGIG